MSPAFMTTFFSVRAEVWIQPVLPLSVFTLVQPPWVETTDMRSPYSTSFTTLPRNEGRSRSWPSRTWTLIIWVAAHAVSAARTHSSRGTHRLVFLMNRLPALVVIRQDPSADGITGHGGGAMFFREFAFRTEF